MTNREVVIDFFKRHGKFPPPTSEAVLGVAYLDEGMIDSLGIVLLISEIETKLSVQLSAQEMQSPDFLTIGGLIGILDRLTAKKA